MGPRGAALALALAAWPAGPRRARAAGLTAAAPQGAQRGPAEQVARVVPPAELDALLPEAPLFSSVAGIREGCQGVGFGAGAQGLTLEDFRALAADFYASGAPRFAQQGGLVAAILRYGQRISATCPHAVMQAQLLRIEALLLQVYTQPALSRDRHLAAFAEASMLHGHLEALRQWLHVVLGGAPFPDLGWPLERGEKRVRRYYELLWSDVYDSEDTWAVMEQPGEISDELYHAALADVAGVLGALGLEWWPCRGTLIALLRHGWRSGNLSRGLVDVVERDIDVMLGVEAEEAWPGVAQAIEQRLRAVGWDRCWSKSSVEFDSPLRDALRRDLLYCIRTSPAYVLLDVTSYVRSGPGPFVFVHRVCGEAARRSGSAPRNGSDVAGEGCAVPEGLGPLRGGGGLLRRDAVLPLARCCAGALTVPCPHRPLETLRAMVHSGLEASCVALPTARGRDPNDPWTRRLREEGLRAADVRVLRERAAQLEARGCRSMAPYFEECEGLAAVLAA